MRRLKEPPARNIAFPFEMGGWSSTSFFERHDDGFAALIADSLALQIPLGEAEASQGKLNTTRYEGSGRCC